MFFLSCVIRISTILKQRAGIKGKKRWESGGNNGYCDSVYNFRDAFMMLVKKRKCFFLCVLFIARDNKTTNSVRENHPRLKVQQPRLAGAGCAVYCYADFIQQSFSFICKTRNYHNHHFGVKALFAFASQLFFVFPDSFQSFVEYSYIVEDYFQAF